MSATDLCPVCRGFGCHPMQIYVAPDGVRHVVLSHQRCACCNGRGRIGRPKNRMAGIRLAKLLARQGKT
jgi:hypothetical protein